MRIFPPPLPDLGDSLPPPPPDLGDGLPALVPDADEGPPFPGPDSGSDSDKDSSSDEDEGPHPPASDEGKPHLTLEKMKTDRRFIEMIRESTLESQLSPGELQTFRNPLEHQFLPSDDEDLHLSIDFYVSSLDHAQSQKAYAKSRSSILRHFPGSNMLSYDQVKRRVSDLSGIVTWKHDMCFYSCAGFTGPFENLDGCPHCGEPCYNQQVLANSGGKKKIPRKVFTMFALGPQIQAHWRNPQTAQDMSYRRNKTREELSSDRNADNYSFDDVFSGTDYLEAVENGDINDHDTVVMFSIDGAQLYRNKKSDCWMYIWLILDLAPEKCYKIRNILPGGIVPGPGHPKNLDSFLFQGLAHVSALQKEGLHIYDSYHREVFTSFLFLLLALADAIAMAELSGSVGHHGRRGCQLLCELVGRNKPRGPHYYPALPRPLGTHESSCNHPDFDVANLPPIDPFKYQEDLTSVITSQNNTQYQQRRLRTGIRKASIF